MLRHFKKRNQKINVNYAMMRLKLTMMFANCPASKYNHFIIARLFFLILIDFRFSHVFHEKEIIAYVNKEMRCPTCRRHVIVKDDFKVKNTFFFIIFVLMNNI